MITKETLKYDPHSRFLLLVSESLLNPIRANLLTTQSFVNKCPHCSNANTYLLRQRSQCDMAATSYKSSTFSMRTTVRTVFTWHRLGSSAKRLSRPARNQALFIHWLVGYTVFPWTVTIWRQIVASLTPSAVRNWIMPCCSSIVELYNMNTILFSYRIKWTVLFISAPDLFCVCGCPSFSDPQWRFQSNP